MTEFHKELEQYLKAKQPKNAHKLILNELGICLVKNKEDFVEVLRNGGIPATMDDSDITLIEKFIQNAPTNKKILLGASLLINHKNKIANFDGEEEVSDAGVKNTYKVLYHNIGGVGDIVKGVVDVGGKIYQKESGKQTQFTDALNKQREARQQMIQSVLNQKQAEATTNKASKSTARKSTKTLIIIGGVIVGLSLLGFIIYKVRKN